MKRKVIVTGGAGFIGSHIVDRLINDGHDVIVFDNESADRDIFHWRDEANNRKRDIQHLDGSVCDGVDCIFHLAAQTQIQPSIENPKQTCITNYMGTLHVLEAARKHNIKRVVMSSTSAVYGDHIPPHHEEMEVECLNPYAVTKYGAEHLCKLYYHLYGIETIIFRYFNVYGDRMPTKGSYAPVIGIFLKQHANGEPLTIVGDGTQIRDFVHVSDVVEANILAMETTNKRCFGNVMNVGTGNGVTVMEIAKLVGENEIKYIPERIGEIKESVCDNKKINALLSWAPKQKLSSWINNNE
jgi:UDP-glucose 4-epimerase